MGRTRSSSEFHANSGSGRVGSRKLDPRQTLIRIPRQGSRTSNVFDHAFTMTTVPVAFLLIYFVLCLHLARVSLTLLVSFPTLLITCPKSLSRLFVMGFNHNCSTRAKWVYFAKFNFIQWLNFVFYGINKLWEKYVLPFSILNLSNYLLTLLRPTLVFIHT